MDFSNRYYCGGVLICRRPDIRFIIKTLGADSKKSLTFVRYPLMRKIKIYNPYILEV